MLYFYTSIQVEDVENIPYGNFPCLITTYGVYRFPDYLLDIFIIEKYISLLK